jgi:RNA polymerase sigma-70 factor (ECF subfamily)
VFVSDKAPLSAQNADFYSAWSWDLLQRRCLREARRILARREDAEEAAQEALMRAWRQRDRCQQPAARTAWVAQIARNEALRVLARQRGRAELSNDDVYGVQPLQGSWEEQTIERLFLTQALEVLAPADRSLFLLRYKGDVSHASLAAALCLPEATVRVRLYRIRRRLREGMGD